MRIIYSAGGPLTTNGGQGRVDSKTCESRVVEGGFAMEI